MLTVDRASLVVKRVLAACGLDVRRRRPGQRRLTMGEVLAHVAGLGFRPCTVIDIGVADGTRELYRAFPNAQLVLVEPLVEYEADLRRLEGEFGARYVLAAAGSNPGLVTLHVHDSLSSSSLLRETEGEHVDGRPREIPVITVDRLCDELDLAGPFLIKADVQGAELQVLEGAQRTLCQTELILLEVSLFSFFINGPDFHDVVRYMRERGFVVYEIFEGHNRPLDGALAQVDVAFVKEEGQFRTCHW